MKWENLWKAIETSMAENARSDSLNGLEGRERMRFFETMKNMVIKYPKRSDSAYILGQLSSMGMECPDLVLSHMVAQFLKCTEYNSGPPECLLHCLGCDFVNYFEFIDSWLQCNSTSAYSSD
jgi:triphosphoribosyl-dephospho-CoA synthetase